MVSCVRARLWPALALCLLGLSLGGCGSFSNYEQAQMSDRDCLARVMYFESLRSSDDGMRAVGTVVMNRLSNPRYPKTVCGVVGQSRQFADGALTKPVSKRSVSWARATRIADDVLGGDRHEGVGTAMFFHTVGYSFPYRNMHYVTLAGGNVFYEKKTPGTFENTINPVRGTTMLARAETPAREKPTLLASADEDDVLPEPARTTMSDASPPLPVRVRPVLATRDTAPREIAEREAAPRETDARHTTIVAKAPAYPPVPGPASRLAATASPRLATRDMPVVAVATARPGSPRMAALQPPVRPAAEPTRPVRVAMLTPPPGKARPARVRSIEDLIEMDLKQR